MNRRALTRLSERKGSYWLRGGFSQDGYPFYRSASGIWLTQAVPAAYIEFSIGRR